MIRISEYSTLTGISDTTIRKYARDGFVKSEWGVFKGQKTKFVEYPKHFLIR